MSMDSGVCELFRLDSKRAVVTGCTRGIGKAICIALAEAGADILGISRQIDPHGSDIEQEVNRRGREFQAFRCDFSDRSAVGKLAQALATEAAPIDILVNNAGTIRRQRAVEHTDENWDLVIETNLTAPFVLSRELGRQMVERGSGKIIFLASLLSFQGGITVAGYAASKGAIAQLTKALANEWGGKGVQVNAIAPGYIATDNTAALQADSQRSEAILARIPAGRWGTPEDLQGAVVFLASRASDYINGSVLVVDGGWLGR
jgi:2-deoxy-D-gluconate 3-dehydrogenase